MKLQDVNVLHVTTSVPEVNGYLGNGFELIEIRENAQGYSYILGCKLSKPIYATGGPIKSVDSKEFAVDLKEVIKQIALEALTETLQKNYIFDASGIVKNLRALSQK